jgi:signal transduction histidine kinase
MGPYRRIFVAILFAVGLARPACASGDLLTHGVLIINESGSDSPFALQFRDQLRSTLVGEISLNVGLYSESSGVSRFNNIDYDAFRAYFEAKYKNIPISVIVAVGARALKFTSRIRADIWPKAPIVFVVVGSASDRPSITLSNATGSILVRRFQDMVESARLIVPRLAQIVLIGTPLEHQPFRPQYFEEVRQVAKNLKILDLTGLTLADVLPRIIALPDDAAIIDTRVYADTSGLVDPIEATKTEAAVANRPIIVDSETPIGTGVVGGLVLSPQRVGHNTAVKVSRILSGESAANIPITVEYANKPVFDSRQLERWGVNLATLPVGSEIRFREPNAWDLYHWYIVAACAIALIEALAIIWFFRERRRRKFAEQDSHQHLLEVTKLDRAMTASAMSTSIAHELSQPLGAILNNAEAGQMLLDANPLDLNQLKEILVDIYRDDQRAVGIIKNLRILLKQSEFQPQDMNLTEVAKGALEILKSTMEEKKVALQFDAAATNYCVRADYIHLQQVILNLGMNAIDAMQNIPADERKLTLRIYQRDNDAILSIEDTGTGIPHDKLNSIFKAFVTTKAQGTGLGLSIARTIIERYGGKIWAENRAKGGAAFHFTLRLVQTEMA